MLGAVNRVLLGIVGLVLVALGGSVLAIGLGAPAPSWWLHDGRDDVLLNEAERTRWRDEGWWWPVVIAVLAVLVLLALWWLVAVLRRRRLTEVVIDTGDDEEASLRGRALEQALAEEAGHLDGVEQAHVVLTGRRGTPRARVLLLLDPRVDPSTALTTLTEGPLTHVRTSAGLPALPTETHLKTQKHPPERVT
ncbi:MULTISPECIES: alkaline shock response membrane anchor protein AmaP [Streptomyces]|uniref:Alkaline shock response membrane anchor protein AmaP n=1 Tax=Streptomyces edwardsiae TaxID=3075527 RepID=A0ABU2Q3Z4_9ACTN|nr:alkaline shock response membrane anchor protein AmaP [Streptomyces sp. DSM 41636]MDT0399173.1 alkaline shock response membrane anchor protein AmaP [Streptomyces sp. DSM 41636]